MTRGPGATPASKPISEIELPELSEDELDSIEAAWDKEGELYPQRFYNAGGGSPQDVILKGFDKQGNPLGELAPAFCCYTVHTPEERTLLLNALGGRVWPEDLRPEAPDLTCTRKGCDTRLRSTQAFQRHISANHPQS